MEKLYDAGGMSFSQRCSLALWLLETHETEVTDGTGMRNIPNFIFGGIELVYKKDKSLDTKVCASMFKFSSLILSCGAIA